jgi:retron-type reverse transcriptase
MKIQLAHKFEEIISLDNLLLAWREFIRGKRSKSDVQVFARDLADNIISLHWDLANKTYRHGGYKSFYINDPKRRHIHKASVRDRLLHHAVHRQLYPFFDRTFIADSFSCRIGKGTHRAVNRFREMAYMASKNHTKSCFVLKCDIRKFFASIDHQILLNILSDYIPDDNIIWLLVEIIRSFAPTSPSYAPGIRSPLKGGIEKNPPSEGGQLREAKRGDVGLPLGNLTSQLFANIYMNRLDQWVKHDLKIKHYIRYADDFVIFSCDRFWLESIISKMQYFLESQLKLSLHQDKIILKTIASGVDFLGWLHFPDHRILRRATKRRMFLRIKVKPTAETLQSYLGFLGHGDTFKVRQKILKLYQSGN